MDAVEALAVDALLLERSDHAFDHAVMLRAVRGDELLFQAVAANPNGAAAPKRAGKGGTSLRSAVSANAAAFAEDLGPMLKDIQAAGHTSLRAIAAELTARGIRTRRGGTWGVGNVRGLVGRTGEAKK
ncbi:recombinase family protein [Rhodobacter sp. Har01]|nr:recombinase family protein [Rhodobacter sp. Har01]MCB6180237.1 recombinase family protein [Rhodobacter sp. Har01]